MEYTDLETLKRDCLSCTRCGLSVTRKNVVFGVGPDQAEVMFIGEGPGENEDIQGEPFVGAAGQLLDEMLSIIGLSRRNCYIANIVKCRPPHNRDPHNTEQDCCRSWLDAQIALLQPKLIICLGRIAAMQYIRSDFRITKEHGNWFQIDNTWRMAMYHPSALLRDLTKRPETFQDLKSLQAMVQKYCIHTVLEDE